MFFWAKRSDNQAGGLIIIYVVVDPIKKNDDLIPKTDQRHKMNEHPYKPSKKPAEFEL